VVRCPLCNDEFDLAVVLDNIPPALIVVSGGDPEPTAIDDDDDTPAFAFAEQAAPSAQVVSTSSKSTRTSRRPKRKQANPIWEVVKVGGGGIIGLSLGQFILWWAFGRDPASLAPKIPTAMQWILPSALRTGGDSDSEPLDEGSDNVGSFEMGSADDFPIPSDTAGGSSRASGVNVRPPLPISTAGKSTGRNPQPRHTGKNSPKSGTGRQTPATATESKPKVVSIRNSPSFTPDDLADAIEAAETALDAWQEVKASGATSTSASMKLYTDFAKLANTVTFVDPKISRNVQLAGQAKRLAESLPLDAIHMFGAATSSWIEQRTNDGVALFGAVTDVQEQGELFVTIIELRDQRRRRVSVISGSDPRPRLDEGDQVLVLGGIIDDPKKRVGGYEGLAPLVILGGLPIKFNAAIIAKKQKTESATTKPTTPEPAKANPSSPKPTTPATAEAKPHAPKPNQPKPPLPDPPSENAKSTEPKSAKSTEPKATEPKATEPKATEPKTADPKPPETDPEDPPVPKPASPDAKSDESS